MEEERMLTEEAYMKKVDPFIVKAVKKFASKDWKRNINDLEDMLQEARLAILQQIREKGMVPEENYRVFYWTINNSCYKVIQECQSTIRTPLYWRTNQNKCRLAEFFEPLSLDEGTPEPHGWGTDKQIPNPHEWITDRQTEDVAIAGVMVEDVLQAATDKERKIFGYLLCGLSPYEIQKRFRIHQYSVRYHLKKARVYLETQHHPRKKCNPHQQAGKTASSLVR